MSSETIKLNRLEKKAKLEVAKQEALYWQLRREALLLDLRAKGVNVSETYASSLNSPLISGELASKIDFDSVVRN